MIHIIARHTRQFRDFCRVQHLIPGQTARQVATLRDLISLAHGTKVYALAGSETAEVMRGKAIIVMEARRVERIRLDRATTAGQPFLPERCPTCAAPVRTIFDHLGEDCEHS